MFTSEESEKDRKYDFFLLFFFKKRKANININKNNLP